MARSLLLLGLMALGACGDGSTGPEAAGPVANFAMVAGNNQSAAVGATLPTDLTVRATDADGQPTPGIVVTFEVVTGGGSVAASSVTTTSEGVASTRWTLGGPAGSQTVSARLSDPATGASFAILFSATAEPGPPDSFEYTGPPDLMAAAGTTLDDPIAVDVSDAFGNPIPGIPVSFEVSAGGGDIAPSQATTDASGEASTTWTLGTTAGPQSLTVRIPGESPITVEANATTGQPADVTYSGTTGLSGVVGSTLPDPIVVTVVDSFGNPVAGVDVSFAGDGTHVPADAVTDADGRASTIWTLGPVAGPQEFQVQVTGFTPRLVTAGATAGPPAMVDIQGDGQSAPPSSFLLDDIILTVQDAFANPLSDVAIAVRVGSGGGLVIASANETNDDGFVTVQWRLGGMFGSQTLDVTVDGLPPLVVSATAAPSAGSISWEPLPAMPAPVRAAVAAAVDGRIYVIGGFELGVGRVARVQVYDPGTNTWSAGPDAPVVADFHTAVVIDGSIHVISGADDEGVSTRHLLFDPGTSGWSTLAPIPTEVNAATSQVIGGRIYVIGGVAGNDYRALIQIYDPDTDSWTEGTAMPSPRYGSASFLHSGSIHVVGGGVPGLTSTQEHLIYSPSADSWTPATPFPHTRETLGSGLVAGTACLFGGRNGHNPRHQPPERETYCYDPGSQTWERAQDMPDPRSEIATVTLDGRLYAFGGDGDTGPVATASRLVAN